MGGRESEGSGSGMGQVGAGERVVGRPSEREPGAGGAQRRMGPGARGGAGRGRVQEGGQGRDPCRSRRAGDSCAGGWGGPLVWPFRPHAFSSLKEP